MKNYWAHQSYSLCSQKIKLSESWTSAKFQCANCYRFIKLFIIGWSSRVFHPLIFRYAQKFLPRILRGFSSEHLDGAFLVLQLLLCDYSTMDEFGGNFVSNVDWFENSEICSWVMTCALNCSWLSWQMGRVTWLAKWQQVMEDIFVRWKKVCVNWRKWSCFEAVAN